MSFLLPQVDPTANLTFNLRLSETEREAKEKLALPFVFSKEKWGTFSQLLYFLLSFQPLNVVTFASPRKSALLHSGPGSGRILYEPDANDDYDQEDPDDDLDV